MSILGDLAVKAAKKAIADKAAAKAGERMAAKSAAKAATREAPRMAVKALPAPPKRLALPAPKPKPDARFKPRGGQWYPNAKLGETDPVKAGWTVKDRGPDFPPGARYVPVSPDGGDYAGAGTPEAAQRYAEDFVRLHRTQDFSPEAAVLRNALTVPMDDHANWLQKALLKYYKNDFGTEGDPLRSLAERGLHYDPDMTPDRWIETANNSLMEDPIGHFTVPPHWGQNGDYDPVLGPQIVEAAPWLAKQPVTDNLYGIKSPLDLDHFNDEFYNALRPEGSGLPSELAVRPESLQRMSFPQAVEHVGRINQFRAKQMEAAQQAALNNPAIHPHKDYGDGMRWVELKAPTFDTTPPGYSVLGTPDGLYPTDANGYSISGPGGFKATDMEEAERRLREHATTAHLQEALKHEGDTMGHCVGGYCDDVAAGRSRIFSLRDAKGQPHVTVETSPKRSVFSDLVAHLGGDTNAADDYLVKGYQAVENSSTNKSALGHALELAGAPEGHDIVQIKGKQNRAPNDDYLPYVQDFVKSGQWGNVGDFGNTGLVKLPDGRYITRQQWGEGITKAVGARNPQWSPERLNEVVGTSYTAPSGLTEDRWGTDYAPYFEDYAYGGRVAAHRDFARHPLAVGRA